MGTSYTDKLKDVRWQRKRLRVLELADFICQECGAEDHRQLHVHHSYYQAGLEPWEYPDTAYRCCCDTCHEKRAEAERRILRALQTMNATELDYLSEAFENNTHGFALAVAIKRLVREDAAIEALFLNASENDHVELTMTYREPIPVLPSLRE